MAVVVILFAFIVGILDVALFFRQIYLTQTTSDEIIVRAASSHVCSGDANISKVKSIIAYSLKHSYGSDGAINHTVSNGNHTYTSAPDYKVIMTCKNDETPDTVQFSHKYKGLLLFWRGHFITSNLSVNTPLY